jgi:hypothetical protein
MNTQRPQPHNSQNDQLWIYWFMVAVGVIEALTTGGAEVAPSCASRSRNPW